MILGNSGVWRQNKDAIEAAMTPEKIAEVLKTITPTIHSERLLGGRDNSGLYEGACRIAEAIQDHDWPKSEDKQVCFLADSLAASGEITARRSRQLCRDQRKLTGDSSAKEWPSLVMERSQKSRASKG